MAAATDDSDGAAVRQRRRVVPERDEDVDTAAAVTVTAEDRAFQPLDVVRVLVLVAGFCLASSYFLTSGTSVLFNLPRPWFTDSRALARWWHGPLDLTLAELALFNGSDPTRPIYLAVNGSIFDVTAGRRTYGPGGSYSAFAGRDATRAFITGCFADDTTSDLRGAEEVYLPVEDVPDEPITSAARKLRAERERRLARKRVVQGVRGWHDFYRKSDKYVYVGRVVGTPTGHPPGPAPTLCEHAQQGRPKRSKILENEKSKAGKDKDRDRHKDAGKPVRP